MVDDHEFEAFALRRAAELYRSAWLLCGEHHGAEDLVQETLARAFSRWDRISRADNPAAYVQTVLFRTFVTGRRRFSSTEVPIGETPEAAGPEQHHDVRLELMAALAELKRTDRAVLVMRYLLDLDITTVGTRLGLSDDAVRSRGKRALARVREQLGADYLISTGDPT